MGYLIHNTNNGKPKTSVVALPLLHNVLVLGVFLPTWNYTTCDFIQLRNSGVKQTNEEKNYTFTLREHCDPAATIKAGAMS